MPSNSATTPLLPDNPISSSDEDVLEWSSVAGSFARRTLSFDAAHGLVVGVFGPWGSGKTSFINLARPEFERAGIPVLEFNPWLFSGADQLLERFFSELSAEMGESSELQKIGEILKNYGNLLSPAMSVLTGSPHAGSALNAVLKYFQRRTETHASTISSRNKLTEALAQRSKPIVVVLDDVDRLSIDEVRELFKLVRLTANFPNLIYVVACDRLRVEAAFEDNEPNVPGNYLEKIFQWFIDVPAAPRERLRKELRDGTRGALGQIEPPFAHKDWSDIEEEIILPLMRNMRDVRRYCFAVRGTMDDLGTMVAVVDVLALEAIRLFLPRQFNELPRLLRDLAVLPVWESNQHRIEDIIGDQLDHKDSSEEATRARLEDLIEAADRDHRRVVRAMIHRLFRGGRGEGETQNQDWQAEQLRSNRIVHGSIFRLYFTRVADTDLTAFSNARRAFECLHDQHALREFMCSLDPEAWSKTMLSLWGMFHKEFSKEHAESGLVVFWNLLPDMPSPNSMFADEPQEVTRTISKSLLVPLVGTDNLAELLKNVLQQLQSLSSKVALVSQIKGLELVNATFLWDTDISMLEEWTNNEILSANPEELAEERHPAQILLFSSRQANPPITPHMIHDLPKLTYALLWDCRTQANSMELGSRAVATERGIHESTLLSIHDNEQILSERIESLYQNFKSVAPWIESKFDVSSAEAFSFLQWAKSELQ